VFCCTNADTHVSYHQGIGRNTISNLIDLFAMPAGTFQGQKLAVPAKSEVNGWTARKISHPLKRIRGLEIERPSHSVAPFIPARAARAFYPFCSEKPVVGVLVYAI